MLNEVTSPFSDLLLNILLDFTIQFGYIGRMVQNSEFWRAVISV